ncbi:MAG: hypothetical protein IPJ51_11200 [Saprospiraceae bacterium]|nr:hypothetical protein [Saprospiraceae bacterium]
MSGYIPNANFTVNYNRNALPVVVNITSNNTGQLIINNLSAGLYSDFRVTNAQSCTSGTYTGFSSIIRPPGQSPPTNLTAVPNPACLGQTIQLTVTNDIGATYNWSASSNAAGLSATNTNQATLLPTVAAGYVVSVTKTVAGCVSSAATINVAVSTVPATPDQNSFSVIHPTCASSNGVISMSGLLPNTNYVINYLQNNVAASQTVLSNGSGTVILLGLSGGTYTNFIVINSAGCSSGTYAGPVVLTDPGLPSSPTGLIINPDQVCIRSSVEVSVVNTPGAIYSWSVSNPSV